MVKLNATTTIITILLIPLVSNAAPIAIPTDGLVEPRIESLDLAGPDSNLGVLVRRTGDKGKGKASVQSGSSSPPQSVTPPQRPAAPVNLPGAPAPRRSSTMSNIGPAAGPSTNAQGAPSPPRRASTTNNITPPPRPAAPVNAPGTPSSGTGTLGSITPPSDPGAQLRTQHPNNPIDGSVRPPSNPDRLPRFPSPPSPGQSVEGVVAAGTPSSNEDKNMREKDKEPVPKRRLREYPKYIFGDKSRKDNNNQGPPPAPPSAPVA
ncbi:hypothetical protein MCOR25_000598 [Pyricularia grisea]|nr:hypothetical protein MCOR25_000598 [Pyricularia grisea]